MSLIAAPLREGRDALLPPGVLGDFFFGFAQEEPATVMGWRSSESAREPTVAVHFRGGDFEQWNPEAILPTSYYLDAIDWCLAQQPSARVELFTDDYALGTLEEVCVALKGRAALRPPAPALLDLRDMSSSDFIVSSPSTYAIWAGILSSSAQAIHSRKWAERRAEEGEYFWERALTGGSQHYPVVHLA